MTKKNQTISLSLLSQTKMALHAARHGLSTPIHGIVLGTSSNKAKGGETPSLEIVDVVPVCHEIPTKPIVDMALRLVDAHLVNMANLSGKGGDGGDDRDDRRNDVEIVGWYTANANAIVSSNDNDELPNASACRIAASMAEISDSNFVLLLVSTTGLVHVMNDASGLSETEGDNHQLCTIFETDGRNKTFSHKVEGSRVIPSPKEDSLPSTRNRVVSMALDRLSKASSEYDVSGGDGDTAAGGSGLSIYDYVEHISSYCGDKSQLNEMDWLANENVNRFVDDCLKKL